MLWRARYGVPRSALDHDQLTHSTPQSLIVSAAVWPPLPRLRCLSVSISFCPSTARTGRAWENSRLKSRAEHAEL